MSPERWRQIDKLFLATVALPVGERAAFIEESSAGDEALRREVEALITADGDEESSLDEVASVIAAEWAGEGGGHDLLGKTLGRYQIIAPIGAGGMGEVYLAQDMTLDRKVAIKFLPRQFTRDQDRLRRFEQEARAASALNHPNIITIYEIGEWDGANFIATEYIDGQTLSALMGTKQPLSQVLEIGCQAAGALAAAHAAGIVHRDIKPANIMLRRDGYIKVLDFGLAKLTKPSTRPDVTDPGRIMGTVNYMSPEQALGQSLDQRTDIYSLGVVLSELATGQRTLDTPANLPAAFARIVRRALEKDRERRYQSAAEFRDDLKRLTHGGKSGIMAGRLRKWRAFAAAALVLIAISAALFFGSRLAAPRPASPAPNESPGKSIAVLPFVDLSQAKDQEYLCEGISEEILVSLAHVEGLHVAARTSSFSFKDKNVGVREIAQKLGVQEILEGSLRRDGNRIRLTAHLINARDGFELWSETFDRELQGVFAVQDEITRAIVEKLKVRLALAPPRAPLNGAAHDLYLRGLYFSNKSSQADLRKALAYFQQALDQDPNFSSAWSGVAKVWCWLADEYIEPLQGYPAAEAAAKKALELNPKNAEARCFLAEAEWVLHWNIDRSEADLQQTLALDPNSPPAHWLLALLKCYRGDFTSALAEMSAAERLDPLSAVIANMKTNMLIWCDRLDEALAAAQRTNELDPGYIYSGSPLARVYLAQGKLDEARAIYQKSAESTQQPNVGLALADAALGREGDAREVLRQLVEKRKTHYRGADDIARVYAALGDREETFAWLATADDEHSGNLPNIAFHAQFRSLHSDPRFRDLLRRIGLDPAAILDRKPSR